MREYIVEALRTIEPLVTKGKRYKAVLDWPHYKIEADKGGFVLLLTTRFKRIPPPVPNRRCWVHVCENGDLSLFTDEEKSNSSMTGVLWRQEIELIDPNGELNPDE